jgi:hypothetical protein
MRKRISLLPAIAGLGLSLSLSGCVVITHQSSEQLNTIGAVRLTTTVCFSNQPGCPDRGNSDTHGAAEFQVLLGYRVPEPVSTPQAIKASAGQPLAFTRDPSYTAELHRLAPAGPAQKWVGYRSGHVNGLSSPSFTVSPTFALKQAQNGAPFGGPFAYRVVTGARATPEGNVNALVDCGSNLAGSRATATTCIDSPPLGELATDLVQPTQDLGIVGDGETVKEGSVARVRFKLVYAGNGPMPAVGLRAETNVPDASARPSPPTLTPNSLSNRVRAIVRVPADTPAGSYDVTLIATMPGGQMRARTLELRVGERRKVRCGSADPTIVGTSGPDRLKGTPRRDVIIGYGGADVIRARGGNDLVCAGSGPDRVLGGPGSDAIAGRAGNDLLVGGRGRDLMIGGQGKDRFRH